MLVQDQQYKELIKRYDMDTWPMLTTHQYRTSIQMFINIGSYGSNTMQAAARRLFKPGEALIKYST